MKITLDIDLEICAAAERLARAQQKSLSQLVSELLRRAVGSGGGETADLSELERHNGFEVFPERPGPKVTVEDVRDICRQEGI